MYRFIKRGLNSQRRYVCLIMVFTATITGGNASAEGQYLSPLALVAAGDGKTLYIAEATANQIAVFDVKEGQVTDTIKIPDRPSGLILSPDGKSLYVTGASPDGKIYTIDLEKKGVSSIEVGHTPVSPVVSADGKTLYVCNRFDNNVSVVDLDAEKAVKTIPVKREPCAAAISPEGKTLVVVDLVPAGRVDGAYAAAEIALIDTEKNNVAVALELPNGSTSFRGVCVSPDGKYAYATHILARYQLPTTQLERGWMNTNALTVIDLAGRKMINTVLLDDVDLGAANPWGVVCSADGKYLCVALAGTHEVAVIDRAELHKKLDTLASGKAVSDVSKTVDDAPNDLSFLVDIKRRLKLAGNGPRGVVMVGSSIYAAEYFSDSIGVVDCDPDVYPKAKSLPLGDQTEMTVVRRGEMYFHDASLCFQKWQSCSSCHPDARVDALNWDLLNDGIGNPKNTKSLLLSHQTPPAMVSGIRGTAEDAVRAGIQHIQFAVRPEEDAQAIDEYLKSLKALPSPHLLNGELSGAAKRGRVLFEKSGCIRCHPSPLFTDLHSHDVGTGKDLDADRAFDTPTLVESWRTAPYLYDGRAGEMKDVFLEFNDKDRHGATSELSEKELSDLIEYVLSL